MRPEVRVLRKNVHSFITDRIFKSSITPPVLEIGPMQEQWTPVKKYFVDTRAHFRGKGIEYLSCDVDKGSGAEIISDVLNIDKFVKKGSVGTLIALEVLEHVSEVWKVPGIFHKLLKPGGTLFLSVPYHFYRHAPFPDFWRISEDGLRLLFSGLFDVRISPFVLKDDRKPIQYTMIATKK